MIISSVSNSKVKQVIRWRDKAKERKNEGVYLAEGLKMFEEAPVQDLVEVFVSEDALEKIGQQEYEHVRKKLDSTSYITVSGEVMAKMADTMAPQGILTVLRQKKYREEEILSAPCPLIMILEDLQDPGNLGTILRTGEGAGVTGVVMSARTVDIYNPKTIRATMGSVYRVPFLYVENICDFAGKIADCGIHSYAAHLLGTENYDRQNYREPTAFFIGNEGNGLSKEFAQKAEKLIRIPMEGRVESLNAAIAASILMYEVHRQRT